MRSAEVHEPPGGFLAVSSSPPPNDRMHIELLEARVSRTSRRTVTYIFASRVDYGIGRIYGVPIGPPSVEYVTWKPMIRDSKQQTSNIMEHTRERRLGPLY